MEERQVEEFNASLTNSDMVITSSVISRGPYTGIAGADMRIISHDIPEAQDRFGDEYNKDT